MDPIVIIDGDAGRLDQFRALLPHACCVHATSFVEAVRGLQQHTPGVVYLDHNLGGGAKPAGRMVAGWIAEHPESFAQTQFVLHTLDDVVVSSMAALLTKCGLHVVRKPFAWLDPAFVRTTQPRDPAPTPQQ